MAMSRVRYRVLTIRSFEERCQPDEHLPSRGEGAARGTKPAWDGEPPLRAGFRSLQVSAANTAETAVATLFSYSLHQQSRGAADGWSHGMESSVHIMSTPVVISAPQVAPQLPGAYPACALTPSRKKEVGEMSEETDVRRVPLSCGRLTDAGQAGTVAGPERRPSPRVYGWHGVG